MPEPLEEDDDSPVTEIEADAADEDPTGPRKVAPARRRQQKSNPPELAARAGEVEMRTGPVKSVTHDEPRIIISEEPQSADVSGELPVRAQRNAANMPATTIEVSEDTSVGVVIHERPQEQSEPVLLERRRPPSGPPKAPEDLDEPTGRMQVA